MKSMEIFRSFAHVHHRTSKRLLTLMHVHACMHCTANQLSQAPFISAAEKFERQWARLTCFGIFYILPIASLLPIDRTMGSLQLKPGVFCTNYAVTVCYIVMRTVNRKSMRLISSRSWLYENLKKQVCVMISTPLPCKKQVWGMISTRLPRIFFIKSFRLFLVHPS